MQQLLTPAFLQTLQEVVMTIQEAGLVLSFLISVFMGRITAQTSSTEKVPLDNSDIVVFIF